MIPRIQRRNQRTPMGRISYTGLTPQQLMQRQGGRVAIGGGPSIIQSTTGQKEEDQGLLGAALGAKNTYDGVKAAYKGGSNINNYFTKPGGLLEQGQDVATGVGNFLSNSYQPTNAAISEATSRIMPGSWGSSLAGAGMGGAYKMPGGSVNALPQGMQELVTPGMQQSIEGLWQGASTPRFEDDLVGTGGGGARQGVAPVNYDALPTPAVNTNLSSTGFTNPNEFQFGASQAPNPLTLSTASGIAPESLASLSGRASNAWSRLTGTGAQEALAGTYGHTVGTQLGAGVGEAAAQAGGAAAAQAGGQAAAKAGGDAAAKAASGGSKALGAAGGLLGAGLSINDIIENGASVSNVAGLVSGLAFAAAPFLVAAGPVGWVALGVGVVASLFDW